MSKTLESKTIGKYLETPTRISGYTKDGKIIPSLLDKLVVPKDALINLYALNNTSKKEGTKNE